MWLILLSEMPGASSLFRHDVLYEADDGHENGSADAATGDVAEHGGQIQGAIAIRRASQYALKEYPPRPPPTIPAMELPSVPRLFSFIVAPAIFPPRAPLTASMIRLMRFILLVLGLSAFAYVQASADRRREMHWLCKKVPKCTNCRL